MDHLTAALPHLPARPGRPCYGGAYSGPLAWVHLRARFLVVLDCSHCYSSAIFATQFWFVILQGYGLAALALQPTDSFDVLWDNADLATSGDGRQGLNSLIILGAWTIWKHRNDCVFNGATPNLSTALTLAREEALLWSLSKAKGLSLNPARGVG